MRGGGYCSHKPTSRVRTGVHANQLNASTSIPRPSLVDLLRPPLCHFCGGPFADLGYSTMSFSMGVRPAQLDASTSIPRPSSVDSFSASNPPLLRWPICRPRLLDYVVFKGRSPCSTRRKHQHPHADLGGPLFGREFAALRWLMCRPQLLNYVVFKGRSRSTSRRKHQHFRPSLVDVLWPRLCQVV